MFNGRSSQVTLLSYPSTNMTKTQIKQHKIQTSGCVHFYFPLRVSMSQVIYSQLETILSLGHIFSKQTCYKWCIVQCATSPKYKENRVYAISDVTSYNQVLGKSKGNHNSLQTRTPNTSSTVSVWSSRRDYEKQQSII